MRRMVLLFIAGALLLTTFPAIALAAEITCGTRSDRSAHNIICQGTDNSDLIRERSGSNADDIRGRDGGDTINANRAVTGTDADIVRGQTGSDKIFTNDGDIRDQVDCGYGADEATIDVRRDTSGKITGGDQVSSDCETIKDQNGTVLKPAADPLPTEMVVDMPDNP